MSVLLGPILQFRGIHQGKYHVSALVVLPRDPTPAPPVATATSPSGVTVKPAVLLAEVPVLNPRAKVFRVDFHVKQGAQGETVSYSIAGIDAQFSVPAKDEAPRMAFASCFGFSSPQLMEKVNDNNERWKHFAREHQATPFHVFLMGGDQVYSDSMRYETTTMRDWLAKTWSQRAAASWSKQMENQLDGFFTNLYLARWKQDEPKHILASIPTIMMWDDHDIFDGWGSYSTELHESPVLSGIFRTAARYFKIFQQQIADDDADTHPCAVPGSTGFHMGFKDLGGLAILVPDLRFERQPDLSRPHYSPTRIVSNESWKAMIEWLTTVKKHNHLVVVSSIPVAYLDLHMAERLLSAAPGRQELEDDLRDHWRSEPHVAERRRLIHGLLDFAAREATKVTIVSGDVHVAGACLIESQRPEHQVNQQNTIHQLIASGMVHPAPKAYEVWFLEQIGSSAETIDVKITGSMLPLGTKGQYLIPARNWLALEPDSKADGRKRLWAKWHIEDLPHPVERLIN